jgi:hypothetical protein
MDMFAETSNIDYHLSFDGQGKKLLFSVFRLRKTNGSYPFANEPNELNRLCR